MIRRLLLPLLLESACVSPDEFSLATYAGQTKYGAQTDIWDSNNWGAETRFSWDLGNRARAHAATVDAMELLRHQRIEQERKAAPAPATETGQLIAAVTALLSLIVGYLQRHNIGKGVKHIAERVRRKKPPVLK